MCGLECPPARPLSPRCYVSPCSCLSQLFSTKGEHRAHANQGAHAASARSTPAAAFYAQRTERFARWLESLPLGDTHHDHGGSSAAGLGASGGAAAGGTGAEEDGRAALAGGAEEAAGGDARGLDSDPEAHPGLHPRHPAKDPGAAPGSAGDKGGSAGWEIGGFDGVALVGAADSSTGGGDGRAASHAGAGPSGAVARLLLSGVDVDVLTPTDDAAKRAHALAARYDPHAERLFTAVQARALPPRRAASLRPQPPTAPPHSPR